MFNLHGFGRITLIFKRRNKNKMREENKNRECEGVGPFLMKLNYINKLIKLKGKEIIFEVFCIYGFLCELNEIKILINPNSTIFIY